MLGVTEIAIIALTLFCVAAPIPLVLLVAWLIGRRQAEHLKHPTE